MPESRAILSSSFLRPQPSSCLWLQKWVGNVHWCMWAPPPTNPRDIRVLGKGQSLSCLLSFSPWIWLGAASTLPHVCRPETPGDQRLEECLRSLQTTWQATRGERPLQGELKLKLHGGRNVWISAEARKKGGGANGKSRQLEEVRWKSWGPHCRACRGKLG